MAASSMLNPRRFTIHADSARCAISFPSLAPASMDALLGWLDARRKPVFVLLPKAQYAALKHEWKLPEVSP